VNFATTTDLPAIDQRIVRGRLVDGCSPGALADELGISGLAVRLRLMRAVRTLRRRLRREGVAWSAVLLALGAPPPRPWWLTDGGMTAGGVAAAATAAVVIAAWPAPVVLPDTASPVVVTVTQRLPDAEVERNLAAFIADFRARHPAAVPVRRWSASPGDAARAPILPFATGAADGWALRWRSVREDTTYGHGAQLFAARVSGEGMRDGERGVAVALLSSYDDLVRQPEVLQDRLFVNAGAVRRLAAATDDGATPHWMQLDGTLRAIAMTIEPDGVRALINGHTAGPLPLTETWRGHPVRLALLTATRGAETPGEPLRLHAITALRTP